MKAIGRLVAPIVLWLAAWQAVAQPYMRDPAIVTTQATYYMTTIALIEEERRSGRVWDGFGAAAMRDVPGALEYTLSRGDDTGQGARIRRDARQRSAQVLAARELPDWLTGYPDPQRVITDIDPAADGLSRFQTAGRIVGRLSLLRETLRRRATQRGGSDPAADRLYWLYEIYIDDIHQRTAARIEAEDENCGTFSRIVGRCPREAYGAAVLSYANDTARVDEAAELYFPIERRYSFTQAASQAPIEVRTGGNFGPDFLGVILPLTLLGAAALALIFFVVRWWLRLPKPTPSPRTTFGSASFSPVTPLESIWTPVAGVFLGKQSGPQVGAGERSWPLFSTGESHTLIVAPTRTGKGTRVIIPTILRYLQSMVVIDPKGENAAVTGGVCCRQGEVYVLNPWNMLDQKLQKTGVTTARLNPLDVIQANDPNAVSIAHSLAETVTKRSGDPKNTYWEGNAAAILTAVMLYLADAPDEALTLARVREIITLPRAELERGYFAKMASSSAYDGAIRENIGPFVGMGERELSGILTTLNEATRFMSDPLLKAATAASDFDIRSLARTPVTLYLVIPPNQMATQATWLRLVLSSITNAFRYDTARTTRCMMLIDELPALGHMPDLAKDLATMSGFGLDYTLVVQDMGQLREHYGESSKTILANCGWKWFCNIRDYDTAKYLSDAIGDTTIVTSTSGTSTNAEGESSTTTGEGEAGRKLVTPDEIMKEGRDVAIVFGPAGRPRFVRPVDYWNITAEFAWLKEPMEKYFRTPLWWFPNPYVPLDQQDVPALLPQDALAIIRDTYR